jgi:HK97 family phage prohead protease
MMPMKIEKRAMMQAPEMRRAGERRTVAGYAAVFNSEVDIGGEFREVIAPGAFAKALQRDDIRAYFNHDSGRLLGRSSKGTLRLREDEHGLAVEIDLPDTSDGRDVEALIARGDVDGMSFGFYPEVDLWDFTMDPPVRTLMDVRLFEVSPVSAPPAYDATSIGLRSEAEAREKAKQIVEAEKAKNFDAAALRVRIKTDLAKRRSKAK